MDVLPFIKEMMSDPTLESFLSSDCSNSDLSSLGQIKKYLIIVGLFMTRTEYMVKNEDDKRVLIEDLRLLARKVGNFMGEIAPCASRKQFSSSGSPDLMKDWIDIKDFIKRIVYSCNYQEKSEAEIESERNVVDGVIKHLAREKGRLEDESGDMHRERREAEIERKRNVIDHKVIEYLAQVDEGGKIFVHEGEYFLNNTKLNETESRVFLFIKAFPALRDPLALCLIGGLLSLKQRAYDAWNRVKDNMGNIIESNCAHENHMWHILTICYDDLPHFLKPCFLYLACYPVYYEFPRRSLIQLWIAEGFVTPSDGETREEAANKYLQQLVQRSLIQVSMRSFTGTIKYCRVRHSIHEFVIRQSCKDGFLVPNPDKEKMEFLFRLAIHHDDKNQYTEVNSNYMHSFLAFNYDRSVLGNAMFLRVLELRNSVVPEIALQNMNYLRYVGLRGSAISELPNNVDDMKYLETLDVRETSIETLPESLWNISTLRHVYVSPGRRIHGPPPKSNISNLQTLKMFAVPKSWLVKLPHFPIYLRKLAFSCEGHLEWECISNLLTHMVDLLSMKIIGDIVPSEFVDTRAFPNLETVTSLTFVGKWTFRKLPIENVGFPSNLTKLILKNSCLVEDPMPRLGRLKTLKFLLLDDGVYTGKKMVCSANGFPQLQFLQLSEFENLEILEIKPMAMLQLTTLRVIQCRKFKYEYLPDLEHVKNKNFFDRLF